jgi:phage terminase small subunit
MPSKKYHTKEEVRLAKLLSNKRTAKMREQLKFAKENKERGLSDKEKLFCKLYPVLKNGTQAAKQAGYSPKTARTIASFNLTKIDIQKQVAKEDKSLKRVFKDFGLDEDYLAINFKNVIDYNKEEVVDIVGFGNNAREVKRMRDAKVVASALVNVSKITSSSLDNFESTTPIDVSADTAWLAIKSLIKKLGNDHLRLVIESCEILLSDDLVSIAGK